MAPPSDFHGHADAVIDGYEATKRIRELERQMAIRPIPIIALTAQVFEEDRKKVLAVGCDDFIRKPFKEEEIFDKMAKYVGMQFVYEEEDTAKGERQKVKDKREITSQALAALPPNLLAKLEHAANRNHMQHVAEIIQDIREHNAVVADALQTLADEFDYDSILHCIREAKPSDDIS